MPPKRSVVPASKQMIEDSFRGTSTRRAYDTYQQQFEAFLHAHKAGTALEAASTEDCTDFFQVLYTRGLTARTIDVAKSAFVAYFKSKRVSPNPAQDSISRQYIVGLQKFNKKNNVDEEKKAHPLTVHELSTLMNGLSGLHPFVGSLLRLLLPVAFLGCYRISEVLNLRRKDVQLTGTEVAGGVSGSVPFSVDELGEAVAKRLQEGSGGKLAVAPKSTKQLPMDGFVAQQTIPTARSGLQTWQHWFVGDPGAILICALKDYNSDMIHLDRMKYSERFTLASAFEKYQSYE
ncbi:hypothetical protein B5M09_012308 [Aphanomyces astaci]|uniref:Core-binding (CB) domain-containing protein n=1 Tax=Aphanomyces astaci TaxID=112090 RepID=A0A3R7WLB4_APHAT|nr:hypothetical protein B5M09_012308 [Aphanomyces astaci]